MNAAYLLALKRYGANCPREPTETQNWRSRHHFHSYSAPSSARRKCTNTPVLGEESGRTLSPENASERKSERKWNTALWGKRELCEWRMAPWLCHVLLISMYFNFSCPQTWEQRDNFPLESVKIKIAQGKSSGVDTMIISCGYEYILCRFGASPRQGR